MSSVSHPLVELTKTRLREFIREPGAVFWVFGFPVLMAIGLGLAFRNRPPDLPRVAVVAEQPRAGARALLDSPRLEARTMSLVEARRALATAKVDLLVRWEGATPVFRFDPTASGAPTARLVAHDVLEKAGGRRDRLAIREITHVEQGARYIDFLLPGLIGLNLMGSSMWGVGYNLVVARKRRLLRRYAVTPMNRGHFLLSYFFSRVLFLVFELIALVSFGSLVFDVSVQGSYVSLASLSLLGGASFAGISLLIGARIDNTESANGWMNFVQLPMWILSGALFSYDRYPDWLHGPIRALPLTALVDGLRAIFNDGATLLDCWSQIVVLSAWGALGFVVSLRTFRWQ